MRAALIRFADLSWRLALITLMVLSLMALTPFARRLPAAPPAPPIVAPLADVAGDVWASRGQVVRLAALRCRTAGGP